MLPDLTVVAPIRLRDIVDDRVYQVTPHSLVIAGFTGRNTHAVKQHVTELRILGIPAPEFVPSFYDVSPNLLTSSDEILVSGDFTSGEVEAVVVALEESWLLCVGSDHTDRALERTSIQRAKEACNKVISRECVRINHLGDWDTLELLSWIDGEPDPYQSGTLAELLPLAAIVERATNARGKFENGDVMFLGTLPVLGEELRPSELFTGELRMPNNGLSLKVSYAVRLVSGRRMK